MLSWRVPPEHEGRRLDQYISSELKERFPGISRSLLVELIKQGHIKVNDFPKKPSYRLKEGDEIRIDDQALGNLLRGEYQLEARDIPLEVLYEDEHLLVVNKPRGLIAHPASMRDDRNTLLNALVNHFQRRGERARPLLVHRLDRDTTGCLLVAKSLDVYNLLRASFKAYKRIYLGILEGALREKIVRVEAPLWRSRKNPLLREVLPGGKEAITDFFLVDVIEKRGLKLSFILARLHTGRTHQIRAHAKWIGHPVLGDVDYGSKYGRKLGLEGYALHAWKLIFNHPIRKEEITVTAPLSDIFYKVLEGDVIKELIAKGEYILKERILKGKEV